MNKAIPEKLYKYEAFNTTSLTNLKKQIVYFGSPMGFNDPYDCSLTPQIDSPDSNGIESIRQAYLSTRQPSSELRNKFESMAAEDFKQLLHRSAHAVLKNLTDDILQNKGVTCFSEKNDDLLMWSHYGGRYKGFCLEFSTQAKLFERANKVRYVKAPPRINLVELVPDPVIDPIQVFFCSKSNAWNYESEWRCFHQQAGTEYGYPAEALTGIYFGPDIDQQSIEIVCLILKGQNQKIRYWRGKRSTSEFRVLFEEFTYTSFLEAQAKGLS